MSEQALFQEILRKDKEVFDFCESIDTKTYNPEALEMFNMKVYNLKNTLNKALKREEASSEFAMNLQAWLNARTHYYDTLDILQKTERSNWLKTTEGRIYAEHARNYMSLIKVYTEFTLTLEEVLSYPEKIPNLGEFIKYLHETQKWLNQKYKALFKIDKNLINYKLPSQKRDRETEEEYKKFILSYLGREPKEESIEEENKEERKSESDITEEMIEQPSSIPESQENDEKEKQNKEEMDSPELDIIDWDELEAKENIENASLETKKTEIQSDITNYLNALYKRMDNYNALRKEVMLALSNNQEVPNKKIEQYNTERQNQEIYTEEIKRVNGISLNNLNNIKEEELNIPKDQMSFDLRIEELRKEKYPKKQKEEKQAEMSLIGILRKAIKDYENFTGKVVEISIDINNQRKDPRKIEIPEEVENSITTEQNPNSEIGFIGKLHHAIKEYEKYTGTKVIIDIKEKKEKKEGFLYKIKKKAKDVQDSLIKSYQTKRKEFCIGAACMLVPILVVVAGEMLNNTMAYYKKNVAIEQEILNDTRNVKPDSIAAEVLATLENDAKLKENNNKKEHVSLKENRIGENIELPFHLNESTFTIKPGTLVYTDEYLGYDGNDTGKIPLYSYDTERTTEEAIVRNKKTGEIKRSITDEGLENYLKNNWEIIGAYSSDGFYRKEGMNISQERGRSR